MSGVRSKGQFRRSPQGWAWPDKPLVDDDPATVWLRDCIAEIAASVCNHLVIATPVYNYNVPAALKAWIDSIVRKGLTLGFDGKGLVTGKAATVLMASGGVYTEGSPIRDRDIATQYLRMVLGVIGITDVTVVAGGGAKAVDMRETTMQGFIETLQPAIQAAAA